MTVEPHDLEHTHLGKLSSDSSFMYTRKYVDRLAIWNELGERIKVDRATETQIDKESILWQFRYPISSQPEFLTFRIEPMTRESDPIGQLVLAIDLPAGRDPAVVALTALGNAESVDLRTEEKRSNPNQSTIWHELPTEVLGDALRAVQSQVTVDEESLTVAVSMSAPMLRLWLPVPLSDPDYLNQNERTMLANQLRSWLPGRLKVTLNGRRKTMRVDDIHFASLVKATDRKAPILVWSARVVIVLQADAAEPVSSLDLTWDVFNSAVLTAQAAILSGDESAIGDLTTYNPHLVWRRIGKSIQWRIGQREGVFETVKP